ncbi:MAG: PAS domain S-box protein, partial [Armatimonadota bacterium]
MEHAKRLSSLARRAPMPVIGIDAEGRLSYVNDSLCALTGYDREQLIGEFFWNLVAADQSDQLRESFRRERENGVSNRLDTRVPTASGGELLIVWHNVTFMDADGHCTAVYSIGADVTALRRAERRLSRLNTSLQGLSAVSGLALRTDDPHDLLARACEALVNTGACTSAWIAPVGDDGHPIGLVGSSMHNGSSPDELRAALRDLPSCIVRAIEEPQQSVISEASDACADCLFAPQEAGVHGIVTAIGCFGEVSAVLITHVPNTEPVGEATRRVMASIADDLGFALAMLEARAMHERAERSLAERTRLLDAFFE